MRAVVQRVTEARVTVAGETVGAIEGPGLCVLVGVTHEDTPAKAAQLARKLWTLRILPPSPRAEGRADAESGSAGATTVGVGSGAAGGERGSNSVEQSCSDIGGPLLVISQFTLYGDARKGRRPTWTAAAPGPVAEPLVDEVVAQLRALGAKVETGRFGADMRVALVNDGPFTVLVEV
ncbi:MULTISPECIES: D-aminoacyl-tRNA deacylase [Kitasatospora]|uniref:D-aminoacyl-tRNA deacylase n=1 Tax=Kitasatospora cathayae TaxID=3004092 RepID=A0ABY7Q497_9ACTN|nr:D-aminoacyl-tRNA deacylase [Kitasatospora sp. HUAS 3-15]WBP87528.1 D-aminoacyl-tRNA deacylase [Kitasatospora sp. HUAS 3-15]